MKMLIILFQTLIAVSLMAQDIESQWVNTFGSNNQERIRDIAVDSRGDIYLALEFYETIGNEQFTLTSNGCLDAAVIKMSPTGHIYWAQAIGSDQLDYVYGITLDNQGNVYATGGFSSTVTVGQESYTALKGTDAYLVKINQSGSVEWFKQAGSINFDMGYAVTVDLNGDIVQTGWFAGELTLGDVTVSATNSNDSFIAKYSSIGELIWIKTLFGDGHQYAFSVATDSDNNYYIAGQFEKSLKYGSVAEAAKGYFDSYILKTDSNGEVIWHRIYGNSGNETIYNLTVDENDNVYAAGYFVNRIDFGSIDLIGTAYDDGFVLKIDKEGDSQWASAVKSPGWAYARDIMVKNGVAVATGYFSSNAVIGDYNLSTTSGQYDYEIFLAEFNVEDGQVINAYAQGGNNSDFGFALSDDVIGNGFYLAGEFYGDMSVNNEVRLSNGSNDAFVTHYGSPIEYNQVVPSILASAEVNDNRLSITMSAEEANEIFFMSFTVDYDYTHLTYAGSDIGNSAEHLHADGMANDSTIGVAIGKNSNTSQALSTGFLTLHFDISNTYSGNFIFTFGNQKAENDQLEEITVEFVPSVELEHNPMLALWPGDTNNDQVVSEDDVLMLAYNWGITGDARDDQSIAWSQKSMHPWIDTVTTFSDTNGDGEVNHLDLKAIVYNFGKSQSNETASKKTSTLAETTGNTGELIPRKYAGERFTLSLNSDFHQDILGLTARLSLNSETENAYKVVNINYGSWADNWISGKKYVEFNTISAGELVVAIGKQGRDGHATIQAGDKLVEVELEATEDWENDAYIELKGLNLTNEKGVAIKSSEKDTRLTINNDLIGLNNEATPSRFELVGNYPNPFNPSTNITIAAPESKHITVKVYNSLGQVVKTLFNGSMNAGYHTLAFDASGLSSGTYIYQLVADGYTHTKKMTLIK